MPGLACPQQRPQRRSPNNEPKEDTHVSLLSCVISNFDLPHNPYHLYRVAQEHEEQLRRMRELEERLAADRMDRLTVGHDRR